MSDGKGSQPATQKRNQSGIRPNPATQRFMFATGIECSYPTIQTPHGKKRVDELEKCGHYEHWKKDFELTQDMGIRYLRYGPPYYKMHLGPDKYDWSWTDMVLPVLRQTGILPIMDLCHFGVPDWIENFQNPDFPRYFPAFARAFAERYPWVWCYTPVNEMYVAAQFSALNGWWNECLRSDKAFVTAIKHLVRANVDAMKAILEVCPHALFIQSESSEYTHTTDPNLMGQALRYNQRRFLSLDLNYGHPVNSQMYQYLLDNGMSAEEYDYFMQQDLREHCVMGNDYYVANEHMLLSDGRTVFAGEIFGYYVITHEYYDRYNLPVMHTETNKDEPDAERWLWKIWANIQRLRKDGVPLCGMTWYSLTDQVDWDTALREDQGHVDPLGLFDLDRNIRAVGKAYKTLIQEWQDLPLLPNGPLTLAGQWYPVVRDHPQEQQSQTHAFAAAARSEHAGRSR
ncbi:MAG TPA: family 1 glycosylhydrolase [Chthonomonadaceae bacterium]|nr:family 1 glycosylhydrolase [Chthonomonadaceae bacterium]